ncbi:hypothetical protein [Permianibacter aggregans]|uniref:Thioredoxin domain-containing protein n=1 Tax=Permianibacter aggregans TaxID=1510150 RepID=A0A4R6UM67_9GAMM|nr:hypothetical protein [Permianibacter aggregans]QGX39938.1 hypothetical protein E2H98_09810 [Permianibacter aggregans]TDQ46255.1 hypothetical protein EV696_11440 [Permianibacter aggregans]
MSETLITMALLLLLCLVTLNLFLSLRLARRMRPAEREPKLPFTVVLQAELQPFSALRLQSEQTLTAEQLFAKPSVWVFLSSSCADCRKRLPELLALLPAMQTADVALWITGFETADKMRGLLGETALFPHLLTLEPAVRQQLNPRNSAPFYLFVDEARIAQASNFIGDPNWQAFVAQMQEFQPLPKQDVVHES